MLIKPRSYPHPVLSEFSDDIVGSAFQSTVAVAGSKTDYLVSVTARTSNSDLATYVATGKARYAVHLECAITRYRGLFSDGRDRYEFKIPAALVDGRVEVCSFILASEEIESYSNAGFHSDYKGRTFRVHRGDVLAVGIDQSFIAEKKIDPLRQIPSIFVVVMNEARTAPVMDVDTTGDKIRIALDRATFEHYRFLRQAQPLHSSLNSMIIVPALIATLEELRVAAAGGPDGLIDYESRRWYATLRRRLKDFKVDPAKPDSFVEATPALAQRLVGEPLAPALVALRGYEEEEEDE